MAFEDEIVRGEDGATYGKCRGCGEWSRIVADKEGTLYYECLECWEEKDGSIRAFKEKQMELFE